MSISRGNFIGGRWAAGKGDTLTSSDPATGNVVWEGRAADEAQINSAVEAARKALADWSEAAVEDRMAVLHRFADRLRDGKSELAQIICRETGKPRWEAVLEVDAMIGKVAIAVEANRERRSPTEKPQAGVIAATRYKPMGVMAVFGPFNMPGHLPNGHIVPALLAGNTIVFKPSELTPGVGEKMVEYLNAAGAPIGSINLVQGGRDAGAILARHPDVNGILFTGSVAAGTALSVANAKQPGKLLALEMGGNSPLIAWDAKDYDAAAYLTIQSAYITSGQRCSCARRLIVADNSDGRAFIERLIQSIGAIRVGPHTAQPEPFMGPVISDISAERLLTAQSDLLEKGGAPLVEMKNVGSRKAMLSPGLMEVTEIKNRPDEEIFGPLLQIIRAPDFDAAMAEANRTAFGLVAGLLSDSADLWHRFYRKTRAGVVYWNRQTTGGSSYLPFGGTGLSGNFRPSGYWAADYCSYPVASMEMPTLSMPAQRTPGFL